MTAKLLTKIPHVIFVLGGPGSGKGTCCIRIAKVFCDYFQLTSTDNFNYENFI